MSASHGQVTASLQAMLSEFWACVDRIVDRPAASFFADAGEMLLGFVEVRGAAAIDAYFRERGDRERAQGRFTRHILSNVWIERADETGFDVRSIVSVHAGVGTLPLPATAPSVIADFEYRLVGPADDARIAVLRSHAVFVGPGSLAAQATKTSSS